MTEALDLFIKLPCPETAINLIEVVPQFTPIMTSANDFLVKTTAVENRGPKFQGYDEWIQSFDNNLLASNKIHSFLMNESLTCKIKIGFHRMRDQSIILKRLNQIGIKKDFFSDHRQFIRDIVAKNESAFRSIIDMVCIHGVHNGKEKFWNGLGAEQDSNHYQISEIMFEVSPVIDPFVSIINEINKNS
ncbi:MAG: hypothetical protein GYA62_15030 [Bacteroidales bacterium]|nr:hypothetical protein [Bacteroidales bacterium]